MTPALAADRRRLTALRLAALGIADPGAASPVDAVRALLALQGQDFAGVLWSIGLRSGATLATVESSIRAAELVRSWPVRSTLHVVEPHELGWMLSLTADRELRATATRHRQLGLEARDFDTAERIVRERLAGGRRLPRRDVLAALEEEGLDVSGQRGAHLLVRLAQRGVAVLASGKDTWALLDDIAPHPRRLDRDAALRELARRYLAARGPATDRDLAWWSGLTLTDVRAGLADVAAEFETFEVGGTTYLMSPGLADAADGVHLLPGFDEYLLGYSDRSAALDGRPLSDVVPGGNGMFLATIVVGGRVAGTWRRTVTAGGVRIELAPFDVLSARARRGVAAAAERYATYLGLPLLEIT